MTTTSSAASGQTTASAARPNLAPSTASTLRPPDAISACLTAASPRSWAITSPSGDTPQQPSTTVSNRSARIPASASGPTIASSPGRASPPGSISRTDADPASAIAACSDIGIAVSRRPASARAVSVTVVPLSRPTASPSAISPATASAIRRLLPAASIARIANGSSSPRMSRFTAPPRTRRATPRSTSTSRSRRIVSSAVPNSAAAAATSTRPSRRSTSTSSLNRSDASMD